MNLKTTGIKLPAVANVEKIIEENKRTIRMAILSMMDATKQ
jgi:hypothetical protein